MLSIIKAIQELESHEDGNDVLSSFDQPSFSYHELAEMLCISGVVRFGEHIGTLYVHFVSQKFFSAFVEKDGKFSIFDQDNTGNSYDSFLESIEQLKGTIECI